MVGNKNKHGSAVILLSSSPLLAGKEHPSGKTWMKRSPTGLIDIREEAWMKRSPTGLLIDIREEKEEVEYM